MICLLNANDLSFKRKWQITQTQPLASTTSTTSTTSTASLGLVISADGAARLTIYVYQKNLFATPALFFWKVKKSTACFHLFSSHNESWIGGGGL